MRLDCKQKQHTQQPTLDTTPWTSAVPQDIFVHVKIYLIVMLYLSKNNNNNWPLNVVAVFFLSPGIENGIDIDIFQGIVSKLEIPVSWQH